MSEPRSTDTDQLDDIRGFFARRSHLIGIRKGPFAGIMTFHKYKALMNRTLDLTERHATYLRGFIHGWEQARGISRDGRPDTEV